MTTTKPFVACHVERSKSSAKRDDGAVETSRQCSPSHTVRRVFCDEALDVRLFAEVPANCIAAPLPSGSLDYARDDRCGPPAHCDNIQSMDSSQFQTDMQAAGAAGHDAVRKNRLRPQIISCIGVGLILLVWRFRPSDRSCAFLVPDAMDFAVSICVIFFVMGPLLLFWWHRRTIPPPSPSPWP